MAAADRRGRLTQRPGGGIANASRRTPARRARSPGRSRAARGAGTARVAACASRVRRVEQAVELERRRPPAPADHRERGGDERRGRARAGVRDPVLLDVHRPAGEHRGVRGHVGDRAAVAAQRQPGLVGRPGRRAGEAAAARAAAVGGGEPAQVVPDDLAGAPVRPVDHEPAAADGGEERGRRGPRHPGEGLAVAGRAEVARPRRTCPTPASPSRTRTRVHQARAGARRGPEARAADVPLALAVGHRERVGEAGRREDLRRAEEPQVRLQPDLRERDRAEPGRHPAHEREVLLRLERAAPERRRLPVGVRTRVGSRGSPKQRAYSARSARGTPSPTLSSATEPPAPVPTASSPYACRTCAYA